MKYKVGDKVRIKSLDWYNENKDEYDYIDFGKHMFYPLMSKYCGKVFTIDYVYSDFYTMNNNDYEWTDEMIDCLIERNGKTYPYKIGDRVVLKGNNRCATITDLKYNSWGNLSYYIKIDNDKDISIDYPTNLLLPYDNKVEGLVEDESKNTEDINRESYVKAESNKYFQEYMNSLCKEHDEMIEGLMKDGTIVDYVKESNDRYRIVIDPRFNIEVDEGEYYAVRRKKEYPKTYEECLSVLEIYNGLPDVEIYNAKPSECALFESFIRLKRCRDAYWKLYGEEMGLGKPWEYDCNSGYFTPAIIYRNGYIQKVSVQYRNAVLSFPTEEMRDTFYENFNELINECKELL